MKRVIIASVWISFMVSACDTGTKIDSKKVAEEMRSRKIMHLNQAQITEAAFQEGKTLTDWLDNRLVRQLQVADSADIVQWASHCTTKALSADSLQKAYSVSIQRVALRTDAKRLQGNDKALQVWDAYRYNAENKLPMEPNVQRDGTTALLYSRPILLSQATCLKCHGLVGKDLTTGNFQKLKSVYPAMDSLVANAPGQAIGVWNLLFDKARMIQRMKVK